MPRKTNPNSLANLKAENGKETQFCGRYAADMARKSHESRKWNSNLKAHLKSLLNDETLDEINSQLIQQCAEGNLAAIKMVYEYVGAETAADDDGTGVVVLPEVNDE